MHTADVLLERMWCAFMHCVIGCSLLVGGMTLMTCAIYGGGWVMLKCNLESVLDLKRAADGTMSFDRVMVAGVVGYSLILIGTGVVVLVIKLCRFVMSIVHVFRKKFSETK